jgi:hypothetical protein
MSATNLTVSTIAKNRRETVVVRLSEFKETRLVDLRVFVPGSDGDSSVATKSGLAIKVELIAELRAALDRAEHMARDIGWLS